MAVFELPWKRIAARFATRARNWRANFRSVGADNALNIRKLQACYESEREIYDGTDAAHPAWWRGSDHGVRYAAKRLQRAIDDDDDGTGVLGDPGLEVVRRWILARRTP